MAFPIPNPKKYSTYLALLLGIGFGYFVYMYLPPSLTSLVSRRVVFYFVAASLVGTVGFFLLLELWVLPRLSEMAKRQRWLLLAWSTCVGIFLVFAGTNAWSISPNYITFLLPHEDLKITALPSQQSEEAGAVILWFTTSLGDISSDTIRYHGWKNVDDRLVLTGTGDNSLAWTGRTGEEATLVFRKSPLGGTINIAWNGVSETIDLFSETERKYSYTHHFKIPFYASRTWAFLLIILDFTVLACAVYLLVFAKRQVILDDLTQSITVLSHKLRGEAGTRLKTAKSSTSALPDWLIITVLMSVAMLLRSFNLEDLYPYADEYAHLIAAKALLQSSPLSDVYQRSLLMVTLPVSLAFQMLGTSLASARIMGIVFNVLAMIPLYWITRKINRTIAVLTCLLYAIDPWIISVSRNVREYAYHPFYFYWIIYGMIVFLERFPDQFVITRDWRRVCKPEICLLGAALLLPALYSLLIDPFASFKLILIAYGVLGLFLLIKFDFSNRTNRLVLAVVSAGIAASILLYMSGQSTVQPGPIFNGQSLGYFFSNPRQQWFFNRLVILPVLGLTGAVMISLLFRRKNLIPFFFLLLFLAYTLVFVFFFARYVKPRYIVVAQYWYIVLIAIGLYGIWVLLKSLVPGSNSFMFLALSALLISTVNVPQILLPTIYNAHGYMPITEEYHYDLKPVQSFLLKNAGENDVLIATVYSHYVRWRGTPTFQMVYPYDYKDKNAKEYITSIIDQHATGWLVVDEFRYRRSSLFPRKTVDIGDKRLEYIGFFGDEYVWKWNSNGVPD